MQEGVREMEVRKQKQQVTLADHHDEGRERDTSF